MNFNRNSLSILKGLLSTKNTHKQIMLTEIDFLT